MWIIEPSQVLDKYLPTIAVRIWACRRCDTRATLIWSLSGVHARRHCHAMEMASVGWRSAGDPTCSSGSVADLPSGANCAHGEPAASRSAGVAAEGNSTRSKRVPSMHCFGRSMTICCASKAVASAAAFSSSGFNIALLRSSCSFLLFLCHSTRFGVMGGSNLSAGSSSAGFSSASHRRSSPLMSSARASTVITIGLRSSI